MLILIFILPNDLNNDLEIKRLGGWSNTSYKIKAGNYSYFLRIARSGSELFINRSWEKENLRIVSKLGLCEESILFDVRHGILLTRYIENEGVLSVELLKNKKFVFQAAKILEKVHTSRQSFQNRASPKDKIEAIVSNLITENFNLPESFNKTLNKIKQLLNLIYVPNQRLFSCHNDVTPYNFLCTRKGLRLIDWEHSGLNNPFWDLANLSIEGQFTVKQDSYLLRSYNNIFYSMRDKWRQLTLFKPLYLFWISVWLLYQIRIGNDATTQSTFRETFNIKYSLCLSILTSANFIVAENEEVTVKQLNWWSENTPKFKDQLYYEHKLYLDCLRNIGFFGCRVSKAAIRHLPDDNKYTNLAINKKFLLK
jgi:thiamine kinase-like enzyme